MSRLVRMLTVCALISTPVLAVPQRLVLDPASSDLRFTLDTTFHLVHGTLAMTSGELVYDLGSGEARGELVVDATATDTGNRKRDTKMHNKVLESEHFPRFVFRANGVSGQLDDAGTGEVRLTGTLEIHGESHPFTLPARVAVVDERIEVHSEFEIPYVEWGMKDPSLMFIRAAKVVDVVVEARGRIEGQDSSLSAP